MEEAANEIIKHITFNSLSFETFLSFLSSSMIDESEYSRGKQRIPLVQQEDENR